MGRSLLLEVRSGPDAGLAFAVAAGARAVVGRMAPSDALVPSDQTVSRRHFAIAFDGDAARIEDLGSSHGTMLNNLPIESSSLLDGDLVAAGETTFRVRFVETAPASARLVPSTGGGPAPNPSHDAFATLAGFPVVEREPTIADRVLEVLRAEPLPLFAILDAARDPVVYLRIHECSERKESLYQDAAPELAFVAPYLIALPRSSPFLDSLVREGWGDSRGVFLTSDRPFDEVRKHLRRLLTVRTEAGAPLLFRFYDPRVLRVYLPTCTAEEASSFLGPSSRWLAEDGDHLARFRAGPDGIQRETIELAAPRSRTE